MHVEGQPTSSDPLDDLLRQAQWPQPPAESLGRLRRRWAEIGRRAERPVSWWTPLAAAAAGLAVLFLTMHRTAPIPTVRQPIAEIVAPPMSRPATALELAVLRAWNPAPDAVASISPAGVPLVPLISVWSSGPAAPRVLTLRIDDPIALAHTAENDPGRREQAIEKLAAMGPDRAGKTVLDLLTEPSCAKSAAAAVRFNAKTWTDALFDALNDPRIAIRQAAAGVLAQIDGPIVTKRLAQMAERDIDRREAVAALVRIHSPLAQQFIAEAAGSRDLRAAVRSALAQLNEEPLTGVMQ